MMTRRQRLETILRGGIPDRPAVKLWGAEPGQKLLHPDFAPVLAAAASKTDLLVESPRYLNWEDLYWGAAPPPIAVEERPVDGTEWVDVIRTVHTPAGLLRNVRRTSTLGRSGYYLEHYLKEPADFEKFLSVRYVPPAFDFAPFQALDRKIGDRGLAVFMLCHACAAMDILTGSETFGLMLYECRDALLSVTGTLAQRLRAHVQAALAAGFRGVFGWGGPELFVPPLKSPECFEAFVTAFDKPLIDLIHDGGARAWVHCHGKVRNLLSSFVAMGADALHPLEPPPSGDVALAEAFAAVGDRLALDGNIQVHEFFTASAPRLKALIREALEAGQGRRFILCPTSYYMEDPQPSARYIGNWLLYIEEARRLAEVLRR
jgi:hypothetical protein